MKFSFFSNHQVQFGSGKIDRLPELAGFYGDCILLITGAESFRKTDHWPKLLRELKKKSIIVYKERVETEPSPLMIDDIVRKYLNQKIDVIAAVGGGSVIDAGKAVSAMMTKKESVIEYLEGVGSKSHDGKKIPFIALPTTSGTGSEATKNAVISLVGDNGFKKSLRHDNFVPDIAIVDPQLTYNCPDNITAACGMDALTQLLESFVSTQSSIITDSMAMGALKILGESLIIATKDKKLPVASEKIIDARTRISYASYISGLTLANAGLGVVHGFASVIGGLFNIPHGVICGTLLCEVTRKNIETLISTDPKSQALEKYAMVAGLLSPCHITFDPVKNSRNLVTILEKWTDQLKIPGLGAYGLKQNDIEFIAGKTNQKNNPVQLSKQNLSQILQKRV